MFKYFGVLLKSNLSWSDHMASLHSVFPQASLPVLTVRPHLEYAAPLWSPHSQKSVESVQKFATQLAVHHWDQSYRQLL